MIGRSLPEYLFIRLCILGLRLVAPLSVGLLCFSWFRGRCLWSHWLGLYAAAETCFYLLVYVPRSRLLQKAATHPPLTSREERESLFAKCFARVRDSKMAAGWFYSTDLDSVKRENMVEWFSWALFGTSYNLLKDEWAEEIEGYLRRMEQLLGRKLAEGRDHAVRCIKVTLDPVDMVHRPLLWYTIVAIVDTITAITMMSLGFRHYTSGNWMTCFPPRTFTIFSKKAPRRDLVYWLRPHRSTTKDPILFLHGIGIGLWPYVTSFRDIVTSDPDVGIIALESLSICMHISPPPLSRPAMLEALRELLSAYRISRIVVASHSYGTVVAAHMLRDPELSKLVSAWLFVDPIPFLLHLPAVAYNFVYRPPKTANEWQLWYFASRDPDIARALARHFFWAENVLWKEDLEGKDVAVVLSGSDQIIDAKEVWQYLTDEEGEPKFRWKSNDGKLHVLYYAGIDHAQVFDTSERRGPLIDILDGFSGRRPIS